MSIDEFLQFASDIISKKNLSVEEFSTRLEAAKKEWMTNHSVDEKVFEDEDDDDENKEENKEENTKENKEENTKENKEENKEEKSTNESQAANADEEHELVFFTTIGTMTFDEMKTHYKLDFEKELKFLMKKGETERKAKQKQDLERQIKEKEFDINQIDIEITNAKNENATAEQLDELMREKKELENSLYQMKKNLRWGTYSNSL